MGLIHLVNEVGELRGAHTHTHLNAGSSTYMNYTKKNHTIIMKATLQCTSCATPSINSFTTWLILVGWQCENYFPTGKPVAVPSFTEHVTLVRLKKKKKKVCNLRTDCIVAATSCWLCFHSNKNLHIGKSSRGECCSPFRKSCVLTGPDFNCAIHCTREETSSGDS